MEPTPIQVHVHLTALPRWHAGPLRVGLQFGRDGWLEGVADGQGMRFDGALDVRPGPGGLPDFAGPLVHGKRGERFLYVCWGTGEADRWDVFRRLKLYLSPVDRAGWSQPGVGWDEVRSGGIEVAVDGRGPDGTPACGTAPALWTGLSRR